MSFLGIKKEAPGDLLFHQEAFAALPKLGRKRCSLYTHIWGYICVMTNASSAYNEEKFFGYY